LDASLKLMRKWDMQVFYFEVNIYALIVSDSVKQFYTIIQ